MTGLHAVPWPHKGANRSFRRGVPPPQWIAFREASRGSSLRRLCPLLFRRGSVPEARDGPVEALHRRVVRPGSPGALLRRGPLRTERATLTALGSSKPRGRRG